MFWYLLHRLSVRFEGDPCLQHWHIKFSVSLKEQYNCQSWPVPSISICFYRMWQDNFLFHMALHIQKRKLTCHTLYLLDASTFIPLHKLHSLCSTAILHGAPSVGKADSYQLHDVYRYSRRSPC
jgi:hypothetical protein